MQKMTPSDGQSMNVVDENIEVLKKAFPEAFTEDGIDFDVLRQLLGDEVAEGEEKYGLNWFGKKKARQIALSPSMGTLIPCPEESVDWDTTQNLFIEGDNLEVLKLLQRSYSGKIKMIYIDPPYNTGNDFIYEDNFKDNIKNYKTITGQLDDKGLSRSSNSESNGRYHTNWLNMMYPRLKLARNLLKDDGVIVVHIDENEYPNLEKILSEIFGEENNLGTIVWDKRNPKGDATGVAQQHELVSLYCKNREYFKDNGNFKRPKENAEAMLNKVEQLISTNGCVNDTVRAKYKEWLKKQDFSGGEKAYNLIDDKGRVYQSVSMAWPNKKKAPDEYFTPLVHPLTKKECVVPDRGWRNPVATMQELLKNDLVLFGADETTQPRRKYLLSENLYENVSSLIYYGGSDDALLSELGVWFDTPKVVDVSKKLILPICKEEDILLDFFAGSATTAHAVMQLNAEDGGNRKFIMVQLPEPCDEKTEAFKAGYKTIAELSKERIRRAALKIMEENPEHEGDLGFKVFKLDSSNIVAWNPDKSDLENTLMAHSEHLVPGRSEQDVLYELLLKRGVELTAPIEKKEIAGKKVYSIGFGVLFACLDKKIQRDQIEELAHGIIDWHKQLDPISDTQVVFRDSAFENDVTKANMTAILEQSGIKHVRSL